jgi:hypothetical protein
MARFSFTQELDRRYIVESELDSLFSDLQTWWNFPSLEPSNVEPASLEYRHVKMPLSINLGTKFGGPSITFSGAFAGYYAILESALTINLGAVSSYDNRYESSAPVFQVKAKVHQTDNDITTYCVGYSTNGGTTWIPLTNTNRPIGPTNGGTTGKFSGTQFDYMTGAAGYEPVNYVYDRRMLLIASAGGSVKDVISSGALKFCVMVDNNSFGTGWISGTIELDARWTEDTP